MTYLLDANIFIEAKNAHYGMDFAPGFWQWIERSHEAGVVYSVAKIADELAVHQDELSAWAATLPESFFLDVDASTFPSLQQAAQWAKAQPRFTSAAQAEFLASGDLYLVAQAHAHGFTVVTRETPDPFVKKRIKIPDVCNGLGVSYTTPWQLLRVLNARFVLP
ncbi:DUF4411 family protein [Klenkia sp. LSe6-5]|uniref:DUF4411 family protein n=1 Tax=Klenkia sesuvii TaxID=3103137 RepID=A0ABU8DXU9_9ACTN